MPNLGMGELIIVFVIILLVFGASRLPKLGEALGQSLRGLKRGLADDPGSESQLPEDAQSVEPAAETLARGEKARAAR